MELKSLIENALAEQSGNTTLTQQQVRELAQEIAKQVERSPELQVLPENLLFDKVQPTLQIVLASDHSSIENTAQYAIKVLISQVVEDPQIVIPSQFRLPEFCPYPGLRAFTEQEQSMFYGREVELNQFDNHCKNSLIAITGASGVGKSSFLNAGIIPKIRQLYGENVLILLFRATTNSDLLTEFSSLLSTIANKAAQEIRYIIEHNNSAILDILQPLCSVSNQRVFLLIDQFEEVFVSENISRQRQRLLDNILHFDLHAESDSITFVLASRKNFLEHPDYTSRSQLVEVIEKRGINLDTLNIESLRQAIENPLHTFNSINRQSLHFQAGLIDAIVNDFRSRSVSLPLVQYLLRLLWLDKHQLSHFAYATLGKLDRVLDRHATDIYNMFATEQKPNVDSILLSLIRSGLEGEHTRKRISYDQLVFTAEDKLIVQRLASENSRIISEQIFNGERYLELTHEIILREWTLLRNLIEINRERLRLREQLLVNAELWFASKTAVLPQGNNGYLYHGSLYQQAKKYIAEQKHVYDSDRRIVQCFQASQRRRKQNFRWTMIVISVITVVIAAIIAILQQRAVDETLRADTNATAQAVAQTQANVNATAQAVAQKQANVNATAQAVAEQQAQINENARATAAAQAIVEQQAKEEQTALALSRKLAATAKEAVQNRQIDIAALLSIEAYRLASTYEAQSSLLASIETYPKLKKFLRNPGLEEKYILLAFNQDGSILASGEPDGSITLWDVSRGRIISTTTNSEASALTTPLPHSVRSLFFDKSGEIIYYINNDIVSFDLQTLKSTIVAKDFQSNLGSLANESLAYPNQAALAVSSDLQLMAMSIPGSRRIDVFQTTNLDLLQSITDENIFLLDGITGLAFYPDNQKLAIALGDNSTGGAAIGQLTTWDISKSQIVSQSIETRTTSNIRWIDCMAASENVIYAVYAPLMEFVQNNEDVTVTDFPVSNTDIRKIFVTTSIDNDGIVTQSKQTDVFSSGCGLAIDKSGRFFASGDLVLWDLTKTTNLGVQLGLNPAYNLYDLSEVFEDAELRFSVDNKYLVSKDMTAIDNVITTWDIETGEKYYGNVDVAVSHTVDNFGKEVLDTDRGIKYIALENPDRIEIWGTTTNQIIGSFATRSGSLELSPDGKYLLSYGFPAHAWMPHPAHIWDVDVESWIMKACEIANRNLTLEEWKTYLPDQPYRKTCGETEVSTSSLSSKTIISPTLSSLEPSVTPMPVVTYTIEANLGWQNTGISVLQNQQYQIRYISGQWTYWQGTVGMLDGNGDEYTCNGGWCCEPMPYERKGAMIGRVANEKFFIGNGATFTPKSSDQLYLRINDCDGVDLYDNAGNISVQISQGIRQ